MSPLMSQTPAVSEADQVTEDNADMKRFIVIQMGARMHYAVPALLASRGMLDRVYLDAHADLRSIRGLERLWPKSFQPKALRRLMGHRLPAEIPRDRVESYFARTVMDRCGLGSVEDHIRRQILKHGFGRADSLYSFINGDLEIVTQAKRSGLQVVHEQISTPDVGLIMHQERETYPGIETQDPLALIETGISRDQEQWRLADRILVASTFVHDRTLAMGATPNKVFLVPYGVPATWLEERPTPKIGRVLCVGKVGLLKGNHYLAAAERQLNRRGFHYEFRVVGPVRRDVASLPLFQGPTYIGQVPRNEVRREFLTADVFVLPTLSEGCALVHLEALACGVPVITTPNCGSVVRDGIEGFIVPIRDPVALADRIQELVEGRQLRESMSQRARARAKDFTWSRYGERLLNAITHEQPSKHAVLSLPQR